MNQFTLLVIVVVAFCYFGGKYCPSALKKNKELLLGVAGGLVLCSFFGMRLEGVYIAQGKENCDPVPPGEGGKGQTCANNCQCRGSMVCENGICKGMQFNTGDTSACEGEKLDMCRELLALSADNPQLSSGFNLMCSACQESGAL